MLRMEHICCDPRVVLATAGSWPPVQCWRVARRCGSELFLTTNPKSTITIRTTPQRVWQAPPPHPKTITQGCSGSGSGGSESGQKFWWTTSYPPLPTIGMPTRRDCFYLMLFQQKLNNCSICILQYALELLGILESPSGTRLSFSSPTHLQTGSFGGLFWKRHMQSKFKSIILCGKHFVFHYASCSHSSL